MRFSLRTLNVARGLVKRDNVKALVVECGDFTDPHRATALLEADLPRKDFQNRPEVWRWSGRGGSINDENAYILLQTGRDVVTPNRILQGRDSDPGILYEIANEDVLFEVNDGKYVKDFRFYADYQDLPTFAPTFTGESARERYFWYSKVAEVGRAAGALGQNKLLSFVAKYWGVLFLIFSLIVLVVSLFLY